MDDLFDVLVRNHYFNILHELVMVPVSILEGVSVVVASISLLVRPSFINSGQLLSSPDFHLFSVMNFKDSVMAFKVSVLFRV